MSYNTVKMLRDAEGRNYVPQKYNQHKDEWKPITDNRAVIDMSDGSVVDVEDFGSVIIEIKMGRGSYHIEGSINGETFSTAEVVKVDSGNKYRRLGVRGKYYLDLEHFTHIRSVRDMPGVGEQSVIGSFSEKQTSITKALELSVKHPAQPRLKIAKKLYTADKEMSDLDRDGNIYAMSNMNKQAYMSTDEGETWTSLGSPWGVSGLTVQKVKRLDDGSIIVFVDFSASTNKTSIWRTEDEGETWEEVLTMDPANSGFGNGYGFDVYDNIVLYAPYQGVKAEKLIQLYLSKDYGATWAPIFDSPLIEQFHFHDAAYDPYMDRIWLATGDGYENANVYYTDDEGTTWKSIDPEGEGRSQFTSVNPLPNMVLFATDESRVRGVFRHIRNHERLDEKEEMILEPAFNDMEVDGQSKSIIVVRGAQYWETDNTAYFYANEPANIYATKDGYTYYTMFKTDVGKLNHLSRITNGKMLINQEVAYNQNNMILFEAPEWI